MKRIVSVSLGSSKRDHDVLVRLFGETYQIERIGTDGDIDLAISKIGELDGKVDAFGLGGFDRYIWIGERRYELEASKPIVATAKITPIVDGSGLKNTLERRAVEYLAHKSIITFLNRRVLMMCGVDRFGMSQALEEYGGRVTYGDLVFVANWRLPLHSWKMLSWIGRLVASSQVKKPISALYPIGKEQETNRPRAGWLFRRNSIVAGDWHLIRRYMPLDMARKIILTNTIRQEDEAELRQRGAAMLITTTPELDGCSYGTNVWEAMMVARLGKKPEYITLGEYERLLTEMSYRPRIVMF